MNARIWALKEWRFGRFLVVGALNTGFGYAIFALLYVATSSHRFALVTATIAGVVFNFFTTGRLVFASRNARRFVPFVAGYVIALGINFVLLEILLRLGIDPLLGQIISLPIVVLATYAINARLVFRT
jgi:putative flippase GtrA